MLIECFTHTHVLGKKTLGSLKHFAALKLWREFSLIFPWQPQWKEVVVDVNGLNYWFMKRLYFKKNDGGFLDEHKM